MKAEKLTKEMLQADSMLIKPDEMDIDPKGMNENFDLDHEEDALMRLLASLLGVNDRDSAIARKEA